MEFVERTQLTQLERKLMLYPSLDFVSDQDLKSAGIIFGSHPTDRGRLLRFWGQENTYLPGREIKVVDFSLNLDDDSAVQAAIGRIERVRGRLPAEVERLKHGSSMAQTA